MTGCDMSYMRNPELSIQTQHYKSQVNSKRKVFFLLSRKGSYILTTSMKSKMGGERKREGENKTLKTLANGGAGDINKITLLENFIKHKPLVGLKAIHGHQAKLLKMAHRNGIHLL